MSHFARIDENSIVQQVIVAEQPFIDSLPDSGRWFRTSYNTHGGVHCQNGIPFRKNYAGIGYAFDSNLDAFIPPKAFASWVLNEDSCLWQAPHDMPNDGKRYYWNESTLSWKEQ